MNRTATTSTYRRVRESGRYRRLRRLQARRRLWLNVHLWLGLGLFLAVIGLTGSLLVFWHEIDESLNPDLYRASIPPGAERKPLDEILAAAERKPLDEILAAAERAAAPGWESI